MDVILDLSETLISDHVFARLVPAHANVQDRGIKNNTSLSYYRMSCVYEPSTKYFTVLPSPAMCMSEFLAKRQHFKTGHQLIFNPLDLWRCCLLLLFPFFVPFYFLQTDAKASEMSQKPSSHGYPTDILGFTRHISAHPALGSRRGSRILQNVRRPQQTGQDYGTTLYKLHSSIFYRFLHLMDSSVAAQPHGLQDSV